MQLACAKRCDDAWDSDIDALNPAVVMPGEIEIEKDFGNIELTGPAFALQALQ